jgi:spermidine synthase
MNSRVAKVAPLLFGSGTCALIYQVVWLREMRLIFGGSTAASAAVLAIFMGGLGLGGAILGRRADQHPQPLAFYGQLELLIAISAAVTPALLWLARQLYIALGGSVVLGLTGATVVRLILAALVLCVPTFLMGGTLPAAAKAVETDEDVSRRHLAVLYGVNTLGAVAGAFVSTFFLLEHFGTRTTLWQACVINLGVAASAIALARAFRVRLTVAAEPHVAAQGGGDRGVPDRSEPRVAFGPRSERLFVLIAAGIVGFAFLLMELVWYRMMAPLLGGSIFTFGLVLAVALLGIGLGGAAYAVLGGSRPATLSAFALSCVLEAACIAFPYALGDRLALLTLMLRPLAALGFYPLVLGWTLVALVVVFPASFIAGIQFPLLIALLGRGREKVGRDTGLAYAWNTFGAIVGSLAGGFGLLPLLSAPGAWRTVVAVLVALGLVATALSLLVDRKWIRLVVPLATAAAAVLMLTATGPTAAWRYSAIGAGRADQNDATRNSLHAWANNHRRYIRWEAEGVESSVALQAIDGYALVVNGKVDGNSRNDAPTLVMTGLVGAILHPNPKRALVIGLGTGSTAGWLAAVPSMERVDVVELEPAIVKVARDCAPVNRHVLENPKVHITIGDAREVLLTTPQRYDMIFSEPSNPYRAGIASLFTKEFYQAVAGRLAEGGIFVQWLQAYEVDSQTVRTAYATMAAVFPSVETWQAGYYADMLLTAASKPIVYDVPALRARVEREPFRTALANVWNVTGLEGLLSYYVANGELTKTVAHEEGDLFNTDDRTLIEFGFARSVGVTGLFNLLELRATARARNQDRPVLTGGDVDWGRVQDEWNNNTTANGEIVQIQPGDTVEQRLRYAAQNLYNQDKYDGVVPLWNQQPQQPIGPIPLIILAESLADGGDEAALPYVEELRQFQPAAADAIAGRLRWRQDRLPEATDALEAAFKSFQQDPWPFGRVLSHAVGLAKDIASKDKTLGLRLFKVLEKPFAVAVIEEMRLSMLIDLAKELDFEKYCAEALAPYEPNPLWTRAFLSERRRCYEATGHPKTVQARRDLDAFDADAPVPFNRRRAADRL